MRKFTILILLCNIFLIISPKVSAQNADIEILRNINGITGTIETSKFISNSTTLVGASVPVVLGIAAIIEKDEDLLKSALSVGVSLGVSAALTYSIKQAVGRPRPMITYPLIINSYEEIHSNSFPSGHTSFAFATATSLSLQYPKWYVIVPGYLWAGSVGYSRMNLGVHYPSDVLAGALLGAGSAWISYKINNWLYEKPKKLFKLNEYFL
ncbi:MAG TPA: phosphatase PAP2 family protein [Paludibacter sp.]|nr:phosphatase PAP2 family protein [Paludibacter sp.]